MTFSYPVVSQMGVKALHDDLMTVVTQKSGDIVFPDYFLLSIDFLNGLEYLIGNELEKTEMKELLCDIAFIVYFMIPYVCLCKSCPEQEQKRLFKELDKDVESSIHYLISKLNSSSAKEMGTSFSHTVEFSQRFQSLASHLLSVPYSLFAAVTYRLSSSLAQLWPELFLFLLDYVLLHPTHIQDSAEIILFFFHQLSDTSSSCHQEWFLEYSMMSVSVLHSIGSSQELLVDATSDILGTFTATTTQLIIEITPFIYEQFIHHKDNPESLALVISFMRLLDITAEIKPSDVMDLFSINIPQLVCSILTSTNPSSDLFFATQHFVFELCVRVGISMVSDLKSEQCFCYFNQVPTIRRVLCDSLPSQSFYSCFWRLMFTTIDQESEMSQFEHILTTPERLGYFAQIIDVLNAYAKSHLIRTSTEEKKRQMKMILIAMKNRIVNSLAELNEEKEHVVSSGEEVKERNYDFDQKLCQQILVLVKQVTSLFDYGRNKCD
ncbi:hypothetical protein JH06_2770 [Blastocystis sp. subtype 4]|uniref:hypothetical protein n=1 Tax=Blastocystis sp. subtype 4 TaxID=944170 RepID=UPI000711A848|nr:hypothetical protein JH06_2770 [Blastocystis sp. subtype 4]KNB43405.1 hypothetical protein JH06_2770 [Blastocystis sp. subtype 4]|eukprot:XP_014526848.1 hypothetical protein JH06_2770 [Blastocystis sp. subtype 4]